MKRTALSSNTIKDLEWPTELTELIVYYGLSQQQKEDARWLLTFSLLSSRIHNQLKILLKRGQCSRVACCAPIRLYNEYYILGGGKVMTCVACAESHKFTILVSGKPTTMKRGWDAPNKTAGGLKLKRIMI